MLLSLLTEKFKEVLFSVLPITIIVLILNFTIVPLETPVLIRFIIGAVLVIIGLTIFLFGVDLAITPIGNHMGSTLIKSNKLWIVGAGGLILGFLISIAEPDLHILARQVEFVTSKVISMWGIIIVVSIGIAVLVALGLIRIVYNVTLRRFFTICYFIILFFGLFTPTEFLAIAFDASGATTGAMTVPFLLALNTGVTKLKKDSLSSEEDSFGLVGIASAGAILGVMIMGIVSKPENLTGSLNLSLSQSSSIISPFLNEIPSVSLQILLALSPIIVLFLIFQVISFKLSKKALSKILKGIVYAFVGLVLFLSAVNAGFMEVGSIVGYGAASMGNKFYAILVGFFLGLVTILAEPAVHVLTHQIEEITSGYVKRGSVFLSLSIGVAFSVALTIIKIMVPGVKLWHYLLPGYIIAIALMQFVPGLFIGIAFDSGGVASGPMTATFILAFAQGIAEATEGADVLIDGFGVISMVALTPLIALQTLGFIYKIKTKKGGLEVDGKTASTP